MQRSVRMQQNKRRKDKNGKKKACKSLLREAERERLKAKRTSKQGREKLSLKTARRNNGGTKERGERKLLTKQKWEK